MILSETPLTEDHFFILQAYLHPQISQLILWRDCNTHELTFLRFKTRLALRVLNMDFLETQILRPVPSPRFVSPRHRLCYHDLQIQSFVQQAFQGLLPQVRQISTGKIEFYFDSPQETQALSKCTPLDLASLNSQVALQLQQGWANLKKIATRGDVSEGVKALLLNFRLPDPKNQLTHQHQSLQNSQTEHESTTEDIQVMRKPQLLLR